MTSQIYVSKCVFSIDVPSPSDQQSYPSNETHKMSTLLYKNRKKYARALYYLLAALTLIVARSVYRITRADLSRTPF